MSEYQYYEFVTVDRELTRRQMDALRQVSTRAEITPTSFTNEYHFGDFRGNPQKLIEKYFDAFVYYANWGSTRLILRIPAMALPLPTIKPYCAEDCLSVRKAGKFLILDFQSYEEGADWDFLSNSWMSRLLPVREILMRGDLRPLYLAWLAGVRTQRVEDDEIEPPVPDGLRKLPASLRHLADFLWVDDKLLKAAAATSGASEAAREPTTADWKKWIGGLPIATKNEYLLRLITDEARGVTGELKSAFYAARYPGQQTRASPGKSVRRTAGELLAAAGYGID